MHLKPKTCAQKIHLILIRVPRGIIFTHSSGRCISSDLTLAEGRCVLSALSPGSALAPPSHPSFRLQGEQLMEARDNWPGFKIYCSRVWTHQPGVNRQAQSSELTIITILRTKTAARSSLAPGYKYWQQNSVYSPCKKHKLEYWSQSGQCPSPSLWVAGVLSISWISVYSLTHRAKPGSADWPGPGLLDIKRYKILVRVTRRKLGPRHSF